MTYTLFCQIPPICRKSQNMQTISTFTIRTQSLPQMVLCSSSRYAALRKKNGASLVFMLRCAAQKNGASLVFTLRCAAQKKWCFASLHATLRCAKERCFASLHATLRCAKNGASLVFTLR